MPITYDTGIANTLAANSNNVTASAINTSTANELIVAFIFGADNSSLNYFSDGVMQSSNETSYSSPETGYWKELLDNSTSTGSDTMICVIHAIKSTTGNTGTFSGNTPASSRHGMIVGAFKLPVIQVLRPSQDIAAGAWTPSTGVNLYATIDESTYSDNDYISTTTASTAEVKLSTGSSPVSGPYVIRYRAKNNGSGTLTAYLYQGATLKATHTPAIASAYQTFTWRLSAAEIATITDFSDLRIKFTAS